MGDSRVHNLLINCIQADRMKVQRCQFRLLNSTFLTSNENKVMYFKYIYIKIIIYVALPNKTVSPFRVEDASPLGKNKELSATVASLVHLLQNLESCEWYQDCSKTDSCWYSHMLFLSLPQVLYWHQAGNSDQSDLNIINYATFSIFFRYPPEFSSKANSY